MTSKPTPKLMLSQRFGEIERLAREIGWDVDFRQIDPGPLTLTARLFGHADIVVMRIEFDRSSHQIGSPPEGFVTFGLPDVDSGVLRWNGIETPPGVLINFNNDKMLDCVNSGPFGAFTISFREEVLQAAVDELGLDGSLLDNLKTSRFWDPAGLEHNQLRQMLRALEQVVLGDGDEGLKLWKEVFNVDLVNFIVRILAQNSLSPKLTGSLFRAAAMNRAVEILGDASQFPINIEALCTMAGASWATLQRAFAEEFGVTPSSYIKSRRLAAVQSELIKIGSKAVISDVANRWGFWHMGSFASDYRKQFGELPSETLRRLKM
jgi:AraC family ethanolamine operon transcriptional activator